MRIVSWNCCGKFREKFRAIQKLNADVYVIQECENPEKYKESFADFYTNCVWNGENETKGLGIFIRDGLDHIVNDWPCYCLRHFRSVRIRNVLDILGVWAGKPYIEEYYIYQSINLEKFGAHTVIIGDFNSNAQWDAEHGARNHSAVVKQLAQRGLISAYHYVTGDMQGNEKQETFRMYRHKDKPYHIDHCFVAPNMLDDFTIVTGAEWEGLSDHYPLQLDIGI